MGYPAEIAALTTTESNNVVAKDTHPKLHNDVNAEVIAIETELGVDVSGPLNSLKERLGKVLALGEVEGVTKLKCSLATLFTAKLKGASEFEVTEAPAGIPYEIDLIVETSTFAWSIKNVSWIGSEPVFKANTRYFITLFMVNGEILGVNGPGPQGEKGAEGSPFLPWKEIQGLKGWTFDPMSAGSASGALVSGTMVLSKILVTPGETLANILAYVGTKGETLTTGQCFMSIYSPVGKLLGKTADCKTDFESIGLKTKALVAAAEGSLKLAEGVKWVYGGILSNGTVNPKFEGQSSPAASALVNAGLTAPLGLRGASLNAGGKTEPPAEISIEGVTTQASVRWLGVN